MLTGTGRIVFSADLVIANDRSVVGYFVDGILEKVFVASHT